MTKATITFRTDTERREALDTLAASQQRNRSFLINEALDNYLDVQHWQIEHIKQGLADMDRGDFVNHGEVKQQIDKMRARYK